MILKKLLNVLLPRSCAGCGGDVPPSGDHAVCDACWEGLSRWAGLSCGVCGLPLPDGGARCRDCRGRRRSFRFLRSAVVYEGAAKRVLQAFKYHGREDLARPLGRLLADKWEEEQLGPVDAAVPVPLHWFRERRRGYNQAAALAEVFGRKTGISVWEGVLRRRRSTRSQTDLSREARAENVRDAFEAARPEAVRGKTLLLIDDVCTTGATIEACARALKAAGARRVSGLTVARQVSF